MKKLFSLLAMAAMVFTACQNDEGVKNPTLADEGIVNLSVGVPELATRVTDGDGQNGFDSAYGAIDWAEYSYTFLQEDYDIRFQLAVYEAGADENAEPIYTKVQISDYTPGTNFNDLRFVPGREYQFVIFADLVPQGTQEDYRYNTADLRNITAVGNSKLNAMDETFDAYFASQAVKIESGKVNEPEITLRRPFAKVRVLTTDLAWVENYAVPAEGTVTFYNHAIYESFNALTGEVATEAANDEETLTYAIDPAYYAGTMYNNDEAFTLFTTYVLATNAQEAVNFRLDTFEADGSLIKSLDFNTEIPVQRNHLTTLVGNLLTNEADLTIRIDDNFDAEHFQYGDFENLEEGLGYIREGELVAGQVYNYETNLFTFQLLSETDGTELREGEYEYTEELPYIQNATGFRIINDGIDVEKGSLEITKRGTRAGNFYDVVFDIYATINGKTENYILTWNGELKAPRTQLAEPVVNYEVDEVDALYITFTWEAVEGAKNYTVEWNGEKQTVEGTSATFDFSGEDTYATAYVTANPELTWSYTASTGSVTVDWKKPIVYTEVPVLLGYHDGEAVQFYTDGVKINLNKYPSLEEAVLILDGETTVFSNEATIEVSATGVVITEPALATKFVYTGSMEIYKLTDAKVNWGANAVEIAFTGEAAAITVATSVPLEEGLYENIHPSYVMVEGTTPNVDKITATMNVILKNGVYTVFFNVAVTSSIQKGMQYVGAIDFEKPYTPDYKLTNCEAKAETILFTNEDGVVFEIEGTELKSGDVAVKVYDLGAGDQAEAVQTAVAEVTVDEKGEYDVRFTVTAQVYGPAITKTLQYVGPFKAYEAPVEPEKPIEFKATYEDVEGLAVFTGIDYDYKIFVNNLATVEYDGTQADGWGARSLERPFGEGFYNFKNGDKLTVDGDNVTLEFVGWNGSKMRMLASTAPATQEPEDITVELAYEKNLYVGGNYQIDYVNEYDYTIIVTNHKDGNLPATVKTSTVVDAADELVFEFFDEYNYVNVTAIYTKNVVDPATDVEVQLTLDGEIYKGLYETTIYSLTGLDYGKAMLQIDYADGTSAKGLNADYTENEQVITFTFADEKNNVNVTAYYQKVNAPVDADLELTVLKASQQAAYGNIFYAYVDANNTNDNYVQFTVNTKESTATSINAGTYNYDGSSNPENYAGEFKLNAYKANGTRVTGVPATMVVEKNGNYYDITFTAGEFVAHYEGVFGEEQPVTPPTQEPTNLSETAELGKVAGFPAYISNTYHIIGETWTERANDKNYGTCKMDETDNGYIFTFFDEENNRNVTITYTEESTDDTVVYDPWAFEAKATGNPISGYTVTLTGDNGDVIVLTGVKFNSWGASSATLGGNAVEFTGNGAMIDTNNGGYVKVDITIGNTTYKGTSKNAVA